MRAPFVLLPLAVALTSCSSAEPVTVGDCLASLESAKPQAVDCERPHAGQVVGIYTAASGPYPGAQPLQEAAFSLCVDTFTKFVGIAPTESIYDLVPLLPTERSWDEDQDREVLCVARPTGDEELTASIEGASR